MDLTHGHIAAAPETAEASAQNWSSAKTLLEALRHPTSASELSDARFAALCDRFSWHGLLPSYCQEVKDSRVFPKLSGEKRRRVECELARAKAATALLWSEFERILDILGTRGHRPILLKGLDLGLRYYPQRHLRLFTDFDLLFPSLPEAEEVWRVLGQSGYVPADSRTPEHDWNWHNHLPALRNPETTTVAEVHGALIYPPRHPSAPRLEPLLERLDTFSLDERPVMGLCPEANLVYLFAHAMERHRHHPFSIRALIDTHFILTHESGRIDWRRAFLLARGAQFTEAFLRGLWYLQDSLDFRIPEELSDRVARAPFTMQERISSLSREDQSTAVEFKRLRDTGSPARFARQTLELLFPPPDFLRRRYPEVPYLPLPLLYPYRWLRQFFRVGSFVVRGALRRGNDPRRDTPDV